MISTEIKAIRYPVSNASGEKWRAYPLFSGRTSAHDDMACHFSVLSPGHSPHPPHEHVEEELLIILDGKADILITEGPDANRARVEGLHPGSFVYYPAHQYHTIRNCPDFPATYVMFKWRATPEKSNTPLNTTFYHFDKIAFAECEEGFAPRLLFEGPTAHLDKLHAHITQLQPGAGYPPHADSYDVAIVILTGRVETLGQTVNSPSVIYYAAGEAHGMKNVGDVVAHYLVFEFHSSRAKSSPSGEGQNAARVDVGSVPMPNPIADWLSRPISSIRQRLSKVRSKSS